MKSGLRPAGMGLSHGRIFCLDRHIESAIPHQQVDLRFPAAMEQLDSLTGMLYVSASLSRQESERGYARDTAAKL